MVAGVVGQDGRQQVRRRQRLQAERGLRGQTGLVLLSEVSRSRVKSRQGAEQVRVRMCRRLLLLVMMVLLRCQT